MDPLWEAFAAVKSYGAGFLENQEEAPSKGGPVPLR
jgi:hypothetical protein